MRQKLQTTIRFYTQFVPLKRNGVIFLLTAFLLILFLAQEYYSESSQFVPFLNVFVWLIGIFAGAIIGVGLLYTLFCWLYLVINARKLDINLSIGLEDGQKGMAGQVPVKLSVSKVVMPIAGYLKIWLIFEEGDLIGPVVINKFFRRLEGLAIEGRECRFEIRKTSTISRERLHLFI